MATVKLSNMAVGLKNGDVLEIGEGQHLALRFPDGRMVQISCTPDDYMLIDGEGRVLLTRVHDLETTGGEGWGKVLTEWPVDDRFASENPPDDFDKPWDRDRKRAKQLVDDDIANGEYGEGDRAKMESAYRRWIGPENPPADDLAELLGDVEKAKLSGGPPTDEVPIGDVDHDDEDRRAYLEEIVRDNPARKPSDY